MAKAKTSDLEVLRAIEKYLLRHRHGPTVREVGALVGIATAPTHARIERLILGGYLARCEACETSAHRAIEITAKGVEATRRGAVPA